MRKKSPDQPIVAIRPPRKDGLLRKAARVGATVVAARVAADTGKKGVIGLLAGMGAKRLIMRFPAGALFVTGAYMAGKIYEAKRDADRKRKTKALPDKSAKPILIEEARKARKG
ncbi:hypothetical protein Sphch_0311 [Sphingobium chlorophenolicum L-1]|uniref:Transmembrane protein n=1 Tax=Sphingobium chlorophenolicum L-1 TaxID=690566 RepID=F6EVK7_SPHCR|nr:hypothetical protein [Sphingobium chlorophenolicum]AEG48011.1 hypothetical protein Sphch_0311 [Sphingobium chlorophenolicum L-1]